MMNPLDLAGRTIVVTGASQGIGQATSIYLSRLGARIIAVARNPDKLNATVSELDGSGHVAAAADLANLDAIPALFKQWGPMDGVVHSAGVAISRAVKGITPEQIASIQRINVDAGLMLAKAFRQKGVAAAGGGSLVFLSSVTAIRSKPALSAYAATKGALISMAKSLALELAPEKIRVNCVCPGMVRTDMLEELEQIMLPEQLEAMKAEYPLGFGAPEDVAYAIAFLLSPAAKWITGTNLVIDGGYTA